MTREHSKLMLPIIQAFSEGECIEYWDNLEIVSSFQRGMWKTSDSIGFGVSTSYYRMIKNGMIYYFDGRPSVYDTLNKYTL
jgi:hypothetical protein